MPGFRRFQILAIGFLLLFSGTRSFGYSVLAHEALIDALRDVKIKSVLLHSYPHATEQELKDAHAFAYGGAIIQDLGYYPHGSPRFSDLSHYVRTGDFITAMVANSQDLNELAFALGALSHYLGDNDGHRFATNVGEPMLYPKLRHKFGNVITYEKSPVGHLKTEFGFDVLEVARGNFAPEAYHDFIGFEVSKSIIRKAFYETYGLELEDLFHNFDGSIACYRRAVSRTIPVATRVAWAAKKHQIEQAQPNVTERRFVYTLSRSSYERSWGKQHEPPSPGDRMLAALIKIVPPIGPLKALQLKIPTPQVETLFAQSFDRSTAQYRGKLDDVSANKLELEDTNYDVGVVTPAGSYRLDDNIHAAWLNLLAQKHFTTVTPAIKAEILGYYAHLDAPMATKKKSKSWKLLLQQLNELKAVKPSVDKEISAEFRTAPGLR